MRNILIVLLIASLSLSVASAEKGIVLDANNTVLYKYDTPGTPTLQPGEYIVGYEDIDSVLVGAKLQAGVFENPILSTESDEIELTLEPSKTDPTQTVISTVVASGVAYLVARRKKQA